MTEILQTRHPHIEYILLLNLTCFLCQYCVGLPCTTYNNIVESKSNISHIYIIAL